MVAPFNRPGNWTQMEGGNWPKIKEPQRCQN